MIKKIKLFRYRHMIELIKTVPSSKLLNIKIGMEDGWINEPTGIYDATLVALYDSVNTNQYDFAQQLWKEHGKIDLFLIEDMYKTKRNGK